MASAFTFGDLFEVVRTRAGLILRIALGFVALTAVVLLVLPTVYATTAEVTLDTRKNTVADQSSVLSALPTDTASLQNQVQILTSRDLAAEVIGKLGLYDDPDYNAHLAAPSPFAIFNPRSWFGVPDPSEPARERDAIIAAFQRHLSVDAEGLSTSISVTFGARDPERASQIANAIVDTYVADQIQAKRDATAKTAVWLLGRIRELGQQAQMAEAAVEKYKADNHLAEAADGTPLVEQQLVALNTQLLEARADLAQKEASYSQSRALGSGNVGQMSEVMASPVITQLREQESDLVRSEAELSTRYGPRNPKLIAAQTQLRNIRNKIASEENHIATSLASDAAVARGEVNSLEADLNSTEREAALQNLERVKLKALEANVASTRSIYDNYVSRLRETQGQDGFQMPDAHVISRAPVPTAPSSPPRDLIFGASIPAGLLLGLLFALAAERLSGTERARTRSYNPAISGQAPWPAPAAAHALWPRVLADVPNAEERQASDYIFDWPQSAFAGAVRGLLQRLLPRNGNGRVVIVTAVDPRDAKSTLAVALLRAASQARRKAVLIDGSFGTSEAAAAMGLSSSSTGLSDVLIGRVPLSRALRRDPRSNAFLLASQPSYEPGHVLFTQTFARLVAHLRSNTDLVLIELAAARSDEAQMLARLADGVVLVVGRSRAHESAAASAVMSFAHAGTPWGVVLAG